MKNNDKWSRAKTEKREPILVKLMNLEAEDWGDIYIYMVKGEAGIWVIKHGAGGYFRFLAEKISGITICKSRNIKITMGNCLSWNAKICIFKKAIPQIPPSQTYQDFHDLLNAHFCLSIRLNKRLVEFPVLKNPRTKPPFLGTKFVPTLRDWDWVMLPAASENTK